MNATISTILWLVAAIALWPAPVAAHSWYPKECCSGNDCAPVEKATWLVSAGGGSPQLVVTSGVGTAIVPHNLPVHDSRMAACTSAFKTSGSFASLCHRGCSACARRLLVRPRWTSFASAASQELAVRLSELPFLRSNGFPPSYPGLGGEPLGRSVLITCAPGSSALPIDSRREGLGRHGCPPANVPESSAGAHGRGQASHRGIEAFLPQDDRR